MLGNSRVADIQEGLSSTKLFRQSAVEESGVIIYIVNNRDFIHKPRISVFILQKIFLKYSSAENHT
jgi:hypothetical protein